MNRIYLSPKAPLERSYAANWPRLPMSPGFGPRRNRPPGLLIPTLFPCMKSAISAAFEVDGRLARAGVPQAIVTKQATAEAIKQGPEVLSELLTSTMKSGHLYAARTTARLLGQHGSVDILRTSDARPSSLVRAVQHRDRRLRFAALEAIMRLKPKRAYPVPSEINLAEAGC